MVERKAVSKRTRFEVFKRDSFTCQYCGGTPPKVLLHIDHIVAVANGGKNDESNLITSCADCNLGKSSVPLSIVPQSVEDRATLLAEREEQLLGYQELMKNKKKKGFSPKVLKFSTSLTLRRAFPMLTGTVRSGLSNNLVITTS
jgi:5-methylcytosine-specific restriction endonuclease McrA